MEFDIETFTLLVMKSGKRHMREGVELLNQVIWIVGEKETNKYMQILEGDTIKQMEMKEKIKKEYLRRARKVLKTWLYCRNLVKGINNWAVPIVRYLGPFSKRTREDLKPIDQRTRKLMTMHKAFHLRDVFDRLYVFRRGLASIVDSVDTSIQWLKNYREKRLELSETILMIRGPVRRQ